MLTFKFEMFCLVGDGFVSETTRGSVASASVQGHINNSNAGVHVTEVLTG